MDFDLTESQQLLRDSLERFLAENYTAAHHRQYAQAPEGWSRSVWDQFAQLGLLGLGIEERYGGSGGGPVETMVVMEAFGKALVLEPFLPTVVLAADAIGQAGSPQQRSEFLADIVSGRLLMGLAHSERQSRHEPRDVQTTAEPTATGWRISGEKVWVLHGDTAEKLLVSATTSGDGRTTEGLTLFIVDAALAGISVIPYRLQDGTAAADIRFTEVDVAPEAVLGEPGQGWPLVMRLRDLGLAASVAEMAGCMQASFDATLQYLKTRSQFGACLASFQALQHRSVDMLIALEQARSMAMLAASFARHDDPQERAVAMSAAKSLTARSARHIGQQAIQMHGGIGMTAECRIGDWFRRLMVRESLFGDATHHLAAVARSGALELI